MPGERLSMRKIRELPRLRWEHHLLRRIIGNSLGPTQGSVSDYLDRARRAGLTWPVPAVLPRRTLPEHFPPHQTVYRWFTRSRNDLTWERLNHLLVMQARERVGREASPSAAVSDSQSVKTAEAGGPRGYDAGKKINGRMRHAMVDTDGRAVKLQVHPASIQDRDGAIPLLRLSRAPYPCVEPTFADSAYAAARVVNATRIIVEIVHKQAGEIGIAVHPCRWVVERFFAWLGRNRRTAKDFEATIPSVTAFLYVASVMLLTRRLARRD
jgi:transposase